ncbi:XdhC family protein [Streptomyces sp. ECR3.8]|uniref:XdhC family protein n=1 Tax=Streptomyces sp. ECR3.8 TaxID=3461009 RepID=UPI0040434CE1
MLEIAADLVGPVRRGIEFVAATVTSVAGSAPRQPGSSLVVDADGTVLGDVSGGCVDAAVHDTCRDMLTGDRQARALRFGYSDADAFDGGLTCGGTIELLLRHHDPTTRTMARTGSGRRRGRPGGGRGHACARPGDPPRSSDRRQARSPPRNDSRTRRSPTGTAARGRP